MLPTGPLVEKTGFALSRVVVPLWILTGAAVKLMAGAPSNLPRTFVDLGRDMNIDLGIVLYTLIGLEFFAIAVMVFLSRYARAMAIFMLSVFCLVLINEMIKQADSCGCFGGGIDVQPWQMLLVDGLLLLGVVLFRPKVPDKALGFAKAAPLAAVIAISGIGVSFATASVLHRNVTQEPEQPIAGDDDIVDPTINPQPMAIPSYWYTQDLESWIGQEWRDIDLFKIMRRWPEQMDTGTRYVVFYSRTCDHCRDMFTQDLAQPLDSPVIAVQIPYNAQQLTGANPLFDPATYTHIQHLALPLGPDWIITAPLAIRIEDGKIACVQEGEHKRCLELE